TQLVCAMMPEGKQSLRFNVELQMQRIATREWPKTEKGVETTASVLESGIEPPEGSRPRSQLLSIDVQSGKTTVLAVGDIRHVLPSPDKQHLALITETGVVPPSPKRPLRLDSLHRSRAGIVALGDKPTLRWVEGLFDPRISFRDVPHAWSPDGSALALIA